LPRAGQPFKAWLTEVQRDRPWITVAWLARVVAVSRETANNWRNGTEPRMAHAVAVTILLAISVREHRVHDPTELLAEARAARLLSARLAQLERQLPADGEASPLWDEYMRVVGVLRHLRAIAAGFTNGGGER
jgi:hypothetical protein